MADPDGTTDEAQTDPCRRRFLTTAAAVGVAGIAGCTVSLGDDAPDDVPDDERATSTDGSSTDSLDPADTLTPTGTAGGGGSTGPSKLSAGDGDDGDRFGGDVALSGDTALVGAPFDEDPYGEEGGSAYVFRRSDGAWSEAAKLVADDGAAGDGFGVSVALAGDAALVGAPGDDDRFGNSGGAAYVFERSGGNWNQRAKLTGDEPPDEEFGPEFGYSVALDGETAVVGARYDRAEPFSNGAVHVFARDGGAWSEQDKLTHSDGESVDSDNFGQRVAVAGDFALVSAPRDSQPNGAQAGSAYVYERRDGSWQQWTKLVANDGEAGDFFGTSVALVDGTAFVGAVSAADADGTAVGAVYVFERTTESWTQQDKLAPDAGEQLDKFGAYVALHGDAALVGTSDANGANGVNTVYLYRRSDGTWTEEHTLAPEGIGTFDRYGVSGALDGDSALVGASRDDTDGGATPGSAFVFELG